MRLKRRARSALHTHLHVLTALTRALSALQALRVRDELLLLLRLHPAGLSLDAVWPALRKMVYSRPNGFTPVTGGRLDKPDRTFARILTTAGYASLKAFLAQQPEVSVTVRRARSAKSATSLWAMKGLTHTRVSMCQGEGAQCVVALTPAYLAAHPARPVQPREGAPVHVPACCVTLTCPTPPPLPSPVQPTARRAWWFVARAFAT